MSKNSIRYFVALMIVGGAASAALPPVVDGTGRVTSAPAQQSAPTNLLGMYNRLEQLQREVQQLQGQIEEQHYLIESLKKRQRDLYLDTDRRLVQLESGKIDLSVSGTSPSIATSSDASEGSQPSAALNNAPGEQDRLAYEKAFSSLKAGQYQQSITDFSEFVAQHPNSVYIPNAFYWLGEASYVNRDFQRAYEEFNKVVSLYPEHSKAKDAMLKIGFIQYENKQWQAARETLEKVTTSYPNSTVASLAEKRLEQMRQENR